MYRKMYRKVSSTVRTVLYKQISYVPSPMSVLGHIISSPRPWSDHDGLVTAHFPPQCGQSRSVWPIRASPSITTFTPTMFDNSSLCIQVVVYKDSHKKSTKKLWSSVDYKFILIPLTFILLRVWSCIMIFLLEYISLDDTHNKNAWKFLTYIAVCGT